MSLQLAAAPGLKISVMRAVAVADRAAGVDPRLGDVDGDLDVVAQLAEVLVAQRRGLLRPDRDPHLDRRRAA